MSTGEQSGFHGADAADTAAHKPSPIEKYGKQLVFAAVALVILFTVIALVTNTGRADSEESWSEFAAAQAATDFANVASNYPDTEVAVWARLTEGEMLLREAVQLQFSDRSAANRQFTKAEKALDSVLDKADLPAAAEERALIGKARLLEATSDGNMDKAIAAYEKVKGIPNSIYAELVDGRIEALKQDDTKSFYAWFAEQSPKPEDRAQPQDGLPPGHMDLPVTLPPIPEELFPADWSDLTLGEDSPFEIPEGIKGGGEAEPTDGDAAATPADGDAPAADKEAENDGDAEKEAAEKETPGDEAAKDGASASESSTPE